jgi:FixJ family two-component response regulator
MPAPRNVQIAVIDDDESFRIATEALIRSLGYVAAGYASAEAFLGERTRQAADCIISDIQMSGMTGIEMKQRLNEQGSNVAVIFVSAQADATLPRRVQECGGLTLLHKPFHGQILIDAIDKALGSASRG